MKKNKNGSGAGGGTGELLVFSQRECLLYRVFDSCYGSGNAQLFRALLILYLFIYCSSHLSSLHIFFLLPINRRNSDVGSPRRLLCPLPTAVRSCIYREMTLALSSLVHSHRIALPHSKANFENRSGEYAGRRLTPRLRSKVEIHSVSTNHP